MPSFQYTVVIDCASQTQADQVIAERINYDENYGFDYTIGFSDNKKEN